VFGVVSQTGAVVGDPDAEALFDRLVTAAIPDLCGRGSRIDLAYGPGIARGRRLVSLNPREAHMATLDRITRDPAVMGGRPCIRGMRVTVGMIVGQIGSGVTIEDLLADYPYLEREDVLQALRYAAWLAEEREIELETA
jgi:uncharacterized protein (DUF433 family)